MDGIIIIDKPKSYTSHDVVNVLKKVLNTKKIGHTGTLDPNATGVLPILIGNSTKISKYLIEHDKTYVATIKLGERRDTADSTGNVVETDNIDKLNFKKENLDEVLNCFIGKQKQIPPMYSAIKINGKKLYQYARKGQNVEVKERDIEIYNIKLLSYMKDEIIFEVSCSKGTYIRTLCEDIAVKLGTIGYMKELRRTMVGNYTKALGQFIIQNAVKLEDIKENNKLAEQKLVSIDSIFKENNSIILEQSRLEHFLNGVRLTQNEIDGLYKIYSDEKFIGLGIIKDKLLKRDVII